jgi:hypothetical protein
MKRRYEADKKMILLLILMVQQMNLTRGWTEPLTALEQRRQESLTLQLMVQKQLLK